MVWVWLRGCGAALDGARVLENMGCVTDGEESEPFRITGNRFWEVGAFWDKGRSEATRSSEAWEACEAWVPGWLKWPGRLGGWLAGRQAWGLEE